MNEYICLGGNANIREMERGNSQDCFFCLLGKSTKRLLSATLAACLFAQGYDLQTGVTFGCCMSPASSVSISKQFIEIVFNFLNIFFFFFQCRWEGDTAHLHVFAPQRTRKKKEEEEGRRKILLGWFLFFFLFLPLPICLHFLFRPLSRGRHGFSKGAAKCGEARRASFISLFSRTRIFTETSK